MTAEASRNPTSMGRVLALTEDGALELRGYLKPFLAVAAAG